LIRISPQTLGGVIHFVGIGGIGMSGLAEILHSLGYRVQGSDASETGNVKRLRFLGIPCFVGHTEAQVEGAAVVVVSSAIKSDNPEICAAKRLHLPIVKRAEMLAEIMRLRPSIAVAGTHGKTTTTSLGATVLEAAGLDPTVVSGGIINAYGTNARLGTGQWTIVEADESDGTFTKLPATIAIVTNIDPEHMDYFKTYDQLFDSFKTFVQNIPFYGLGILCYDHPETRRLAQEVTERRTVTYGLEAGADVRAVNLSAKPEGIHFDIELSDRFYQLCRTQQQLPTVKGYFLPMVGYHNVQNALSIIICGLELGLTHAQIQLGMASFAGVKRRFTHVGEWNNITFIDDYAHHPNEISVVLNAAKKVARGKVIAVMQPHRYSRFESLFDDFCKCFDEVDELIITPIYAAGEKPTTELTHVSLAQAVSKRRKIPINTVVNQQELIPLLSEKAASNDYIIFMGAGDITQWAYQVYQDIQLTDHESA
jgi:UDP-N-acetylmuramate--alanine ligase